MSSSYGYMAKIGADTSGLQTALKGVDTQLRAVDREINATNRSIKAAGNAGVNSFEIMGQKATLLADGIATTENKLKELRSVEEQMKSALSSGSISADQYREYQREIVNTEAQLQRYRNQLEDVNNEMFGLNEQTRINEENQKKFKDSLSKISSAAEKVGKDLKEFIKIIAAAGTAVGAAGTAVGKYAVNVGSAFEGAMSSVKAYSGASGEEFKALEEAAKEAGATTSKSAKESADALGYMALAGWDTKEMLEGLNPILRASEAGNADLARTSDLVTDSMSAMGIKTEDLAHYLDVCSAAQSNSNTSLTALLEAYINCGGTMRNLNISIEESATWLGVLANRGIKASEAGTAFNSILVNLIGANKSADTALKQLGVSAWDSEGNFIGLTETLKLLDTALADCTAQERSFFEAKIGGKTQMDTLQALLSGLNDEYGELYNVLNDCEGALGDTAQTMQDNLTGAITIMRSALEGVGVEIYGYLEEPLRSTVEAVTELLDGINNSIKNGELSETLEKIGDKLGKLLKKIAEFMADDGLPFLIDGLDKLTSVLGFLIDHAEAVTSVLSGIGAGFAALKIGTLVVDVMALAGAIKAVIPAMAAAGTSAAGLSAVLNAIPAVAIATAITGITAALISYQIEAQKSAIEATKISEEFSKAADNFISANKELISSANERRNAEREAARETEKQIEAADKAKEKLDKLCTANGDLKDASLDVNEELKILNETFGTQLTVIDGQIQGWKDLQNSYESYCQSLRKNALLEAGHDDYVNAVSGLDGLKNSYKEAAIARAEASKAYEDYMREYSGTTMFDGSVAEQLQNNLRQANLNLDSAKANLDLAEKKIDDYEQLSADAQNISMGLNGSAGQYAGMQAEAAANSNPNNTKYSETMDKLRQQNDEEIEAKATELDRKLKFHQITEDEYYSELEKFLNENVDKESEVYWKYQDKVDEYKNKNSKTKGTSGTPTSTTLTETMSQADKELQAFADDLDHKLKTHQITQEQYDEALDEYLKAHVDKDSELWNKYNDELIKRQNERAEKKKSEAEKKSDEELKAKKEALDKQLKNGEITLDEYVAGMRKILDEADVKETDLWQSYAEETADKAAESIKKKQEAIKTAVTDINKAMKEAAEEIENIRKNAADNISSGSLFDNVETTKGTRPVFHDLSKRAAEIRQYTANYKKLSEMDNIPPDLLAEIKSMNFDDRRAVVSELLKMTESNRQRYFKDYSSYKAAAREAAKIETSGEVSEIADNLGNTVTDTLAGVNIFDIGAAMGSQWMQGFKSSMSPVNAADVVSISSSGYSGAARQHNTSQSSTPMIPITTPINIILGKETITTTIKDVLTDNGLMGRGNSRL